MDNISVMVLLSLGVAFVVALATVLILKFVFKWVNVKDIPASEIENAAKRMMGDRMKRAEQEIDEMKEREEKRIKEMRRESTEHEEILIEREKKLNKRSRLLDEKSEDLNSREVKLKDSIERLEEDRNELKRSWRGFQVFQKKRPERNWLRRSIRI